MNATVRSDLTCHSPEFNEPKPSPPLLGGRTGRFPIAPAQRRPPPAALPLPGPEGPSRARCTPLSAADHRRDLHSARSRDIDLFEPSSRNSRNQSSSRNHLSCAYPVIVI